MTEENDWTEDQITVACYIYLFSDKVTVKEKRLVSEITGRTVKAVGAKIDNLKRFDAEAVRNGSYWAHGSKLDGVVWNKFEDDPERMIERAKQIIAGSGKVDPSVLTAFHPVIDPELTALGPGVERTALVKVRVNQMAFRRAVLQASGHRCCVTGITESSSLVASHIKPWAECTPDEKTDIHNALCLNVLHDSLFDKFFMTIDVDGNIIYSKGLEKKFGKEFYRSAVARYDRINVSDSNRPDPKYVQYHNSRFEEVTGERIR